MSMSGSFGNLVPQQLDLDFNVSTLFLVPELVAGKAFSSHLVPGSFDNFFLIFM